MAIVRCRLNQRNKDATYSVLHLETEASLVLASDGRPITEVIDEVNSNLDAAGAVHATTHAIGGTDPVTPEMIGAAKSTEVDPLKEKLAELEAAIDDTAGKVLTTITGVPFPKNTLVYNGTEQSPEWNGYDPTIMTVGGIIKGTDANTYDAIFIANKGYQWSDGSVTQTVQWTIERATIAAVPSQNGSLTYNGNAQIPSWANYDISKMDISGDVSGTNAGNYTAIFTPKANYKWSDNTTEGKNVGWTIGKAAGSLSLSKSNVSFITADGSDVIDVTHNSTGEIHAISNNVNIAKCEVKGNTVTIRSGNTNGSCSVGITVDSDINYTTSPTKYVSVNRDVFTVPTTLGSILSWAGYQWIVVHVEGDMVYLACTTIYELCQFSSGSNYYYGGSHLVTRVREFEKSLPADDLAKAETIYVSGMEEKIWVATYAQMNGGFQYFNSNARRVCNYNGTPGIYWTRTNLSGDYYRYVYTVNTDGSFLDHSYGGYPASYAAGFRPFVAFKRT